MTGEPPEHIPYHVDSVQKQDDLQPGGRFVEVYEVHFTGPSGTPDSVRIPVAQAQPAQVDQVIQARLEQLEALHQLGPQPHPDNLAG